MVESDSGINLVNREVTFMDLGLITYKEAWDLQEKLHKGIADVKMQNRASGETRRTMNYLLFRSEEHTSELQSHSGSRMPSSA